MAKSKAKAKAKPNVQVADDPWKEAIEHLRGIDEAWADLIDRVGPCVMRPRPDHFSILVRSIIGQQISSKAAVSIDAKLRALAGDPHQPALLIALGEASLRSVGLSGVKARYVLNLAEAVQSGQIPLEKLGELDDDEIVKLLTAIKGVGVWTAEMFLMFALARPDVLPVADLAIRSAIRNRFNLDEMPKAAHCKTLGESWRPYRSVASWYLWQSLKFPKAAEPEKLPPAILEAPPTVKAPKASKAKSKVKAKAKSKAKTKAKAKGKSK